MTELKSKQKKINHPRDIYPHCSAEFGIGVRAFMNGEGLNDDYRNSNEFKEGWICADRDKVNEKYFY